MAKCKSPSKKSLILSLALTLSLSGASISSLVLAPVSLAAGGAGSWLDNEKTLLDRGKHDYQTGEFDKALRELTECLKLNPNRADVYYWRSLCFSAIKQHEPALNDLTEALRLDPESAVVYLNRGLLYSNIGKHDLAIADFDQALKLDPTLTEARQNRDFCLKETERVKLAEQKSKDQANQANIAASGGDVLAVSSGNTSSSSTSGTSSSGTIASSQLGKGNTYTPYVGKTAVDPKVIALQKEQKEIEAKLFREKAEAERMAAERARAEMKSRELAIREKEAEARLEREKAKRELAESKKLAMAAPVSHPTEAASGHESGANKGHAGKKVEAKGEHASSGGKVETEEDALEIVNRPVRDKWALIIGISNFQDSKLNLHYPAKDAKDFSEFLIKEGNFAKDHVKLLINEQATRANILSDLGDKWLPRVANPDDLVLIYISSHGSPSEMDNAGVNYLLAYDTDVDNLYASGLPMQDLTRVIKARVHSDRVVVVLDACHSGAAEAGGKGISYKGNVDADFVAQGTGQLVISSSSPSQVSWESKAYQNSIFTRCLIDALRKNGTATTLGEAFQTMRDQVQEQVLRERGVLQTPVLKSKWKGSDLRISTPPAAPRVGL
ncbi:MAG: caspase family protein [Cyanobacteria bacterium SZAS LIN-3]|nr:caspase family protein [Cyanobacteria bacterium SZAS LIN-3]